ncbi:DUF6515 family protein [Arcicella aquatica]|uniref:DUF6515 family protein n=1 Tax=Arcicella aquatica TaxID=217141 RepID=A0ABU5QTV7_9BACT|nr:DUF6515 family protein [Arcicella aquatica]MEA5260140.1 DUF6515 family protein [Arcicella aquatica]
MKAMHIQPNTSIEVGSKSKIKLATIILMASISLNSFVSVAQHGDRGRDDKGKNEKHNDNNNGRGNERARVDNHVDRNDNRGNGGNNNGAYNGGGNNRYDNNNRGNDRYDNNRKVIVNRRPVVNQTTVVYRNNTPNWRYASLPRRNTVVNVAPSTSISVSFGGINFRYDNGVYYRPYQNTYVVAPAPIGIRVKYLPREHRVFNLYNRPYHYYNGAYYEYQNNDYVVVPPPIGALVESIPDGYEKLQINGDTYYIVDGIQYRAVLQNGEIWYEVIKIIS